MALEFRRVPAPVACFGHVGRRRQMLRSAAQNAPGSLRHPVDTAGASAGPAGSTSAASKSPDGPRPKRSVAAGARPPPRRRWRGRCWRSAASRRRCGRSARRRPAQSASGIPGPRSRTASTASPPSRRTSSVTGGGAVAEGVVDKVLAGLDQRQRVGAAGHLVLGQLEPRSSACRRRRVPPRRCGSRWFAGRRVSCGAASARWMISAWLRSWSVSRLRPTARSWMRATIARWRLGVGLVGGELGLGPHRRRPGCAAGARRRRSGCA